MITVILYYDYLLTVPAEVERFWSSKSFTWTCFFFYLNRYLSVLGHVPVAFDDFWITNSPRRLDVSAVSSLFS